ncbi:hypothetical protein I4U23_015668 [Adineta vaga]|nr:hypothetical protein I4U23_015668 [Adineta vaga]
MATHEKCKSNYDDWKTSVHCSLKNVFNSTTAYLVGENIRKILGISHFRPDEMARLVPSPYDFTCKREDANNIRDQLVSVTTDSHRHIWFSMQTNPFHYIYKTHSMINEDPVPPTKEYPVYCYFGSMYSYSTFKIHSEEHPVRHDLRVLKWHEEPEAIRITTTDKSKEISIPIRWIQKPILVNLKDRPCVVLMLKYSVKMKKRIKMKGREKYERVCKSDDNRFMTVVSKSSDILLSFSEISHTYAFIEELTRETDEYHDKFTVNFVTLEQNVVKKENQLFYLPSSASHNQHYALNMLFSMGYVFHDKYSQQLHDEFVKFDKDSFNDMCYYLKEKLELNHCYRIKGIYAEFDAYLKEKRKDEKDLEEPKLPYCVGCISITPLRILYQKMQSTIGNRALRLKTFGGPDMFLLVHIREEDNGKLKDYDRTMKFD